MPRKLTENQKAFLDILDGKNALASFRIERDGTVMPYESEMRIVRQLLKRKLIKWVYVDTEGYNRNGIVRIDHIPVINESIT